MTLTQLAQLTTADGDTVTLFQTDERMGPAYGDPAPFGFDGHRRRYVFSLEGNGATGWGAVGASIEWRDRDDRRDVDAWESGATAFLTPWADTDTFGDNEDFSPITIRGAAYRFGFHWRRFTHGGPMAGEWRISHAGLERTNGAMTDAGRKRVSHVLEAARDLFLSLPNAETEVTRRSLDSERAKQHKIMEAASAAMVKLTDRINAL